MTGKAGWRYSDRVATTGRQFMFTRTTMDNGQLFLFYDVSRYGTPRTDTDSRVVIDFSLRT